MLPTSHYYSGSECTKPGLSAKFVYCILHQLHIVCSRKCLFGQPSSKLVWVSVYCLLVYMYVCVYRTVKTLLYCATCRRIAHCNMGCLAIFLLHKALHEVELTLLFAMDCSNWQHHCTVYHPSSNLSRNFTAVLTRVHAHTSCIVFRSE